MTILRRAHKTTVVFTTILLVSGLSALPRVAGHGLTTQPTMCSAGARLAARDAASEKRAMAAFDKLALRFEEVGEQENVRFAARAQAMTVGILPTEAVMVLSGPKKSAEQVSNPATNNGDVNLLRHAAIPFGIGSSRETTVKMKLIGANRRARVNGERQLAGRTNYLVGNEASRWRKGVANYGQVRVEQAYRGIDMIYYGSGQQLEYDFNVAPGADVKAIRMRFAGAKTVRLNETGDLLIETAGGTLLHRKPVAYQEINGVCRPVSARYVVDLRHDIEFAVGDYDKRSTLIIDPVLGYSSYFGGRGDDTVKSVAVDASGNVYITGSTISVDFPVRSSLQPFSFFSYEVFVTKLDATGTELLYSTYLGGGGQDAGNSIAVDAAGNAYVTGLTTSTNFPVTSGAFQTALVGNRSSNAFISKLAADGSVLSYSSYLGGSSDGRGNGASDYANSIAVDSGGNAYVTGLAASVDFPTTTAAPKRIVSNADAFVTKMNATGSALIYSTYLGGAGYDEARSIAIDADGNAYVAGSTQSIDFPVTPGAVQFENNSATGLYNGFVTKLNAAGTTLMYSTYLGGSGSDKCEAIAVDRAGNAFVAGSTTSFDFPTTSGAIKRVSGAGFYKSTNGGKRWDISNAGLSALTPTAFAVDPTASGRLFLGTRDGLFASTDGGDNWKPRSMVKITRLLVDPINPATLYAIGTGSDGSTILKSSDSGSTWAPVTNGLPFLFSPGQLVIDPVNSSTLYAGGIGFENHGEAPPTARYFFKSTDGGASWDEIRLFAPLSIQAILIDPLDHTRVFVQSEFLLLRTQNSGAGWRLMNGNLNYEPFAVDPKTPGVLYGLGLNNSIGRSTNDGMTWSEISKDLPLYSLRSSAIVPTTPTRLYLGLEDGIFKSVDGGVFFQQSSLRGDVAFVAFDPMNASTVYAGVNDRSDGFVTKLNASGSALLFSTLLGGQSYDVALGIAVDKSGDVYVAGETVSTTFPTLNALQSSRSQAIRHFSSNILAGFLTKLNGSRGELLYSTYLGGDDDTSAKSIAFNPRGDLYVVGDTTSSAFPTQRAFQSAFAGEQDGFILRLDAPAVGLVALSGKQLTIVGSGFDVGAVLLVDDKEQQTSNSTNPNVRLIAKKAAVGIAPGQTVRIRVRNIDGTLSNEFLFTRPRIE